MLATLMHDYPDTLVRAAGDGEIELTDTRLDQNTPYESQIIADYSPFTILEFRDWVRHTGLYGPGAQYDGQGRVASGTRYQDDVAGLANFNADFGTSFATWDLCYFNWSLADPIDGDPNAIPASQYTQSTWSPLPTDGPAYIANGFDAPRAWNLPTAQFWQLWLEFREQMISNYVKDFTTWMMTTTTTDGLTVSPSRWYTYQIPADYIYGTYPGCANPDRRLLVGASTMQSANVGSAAGVGLTVFDQYFWNGSTNYYERTSQYLFPAMAAAGFPNWGMIEFNLASPINAVETDPTVIANQIYKGYAAGCHVYAYCPTSQDPDDINWPANIEGLKMFVGRVAFQPRDSAHTRLRAAAGLRRQRVCDRVRLEPDVVATHLPRAGPAIVVPVAGLPPVRGLAWAHFRLLARHRHPAQDHHGHRRLRSGPFSRPDVLQDCRGQRPAAVRRSLPGPSGRCTATHDRDPDDHGTDAQSGAGQWRRQLHVDFDRRGLGVRPPYVRRADRRDDLLRLSGWRGIDLGAAQSSRRRLHLRRPCLLRGSE